MEHPIKWTVAIIVLLGLWLIIAPFILGAPFIDQLNDVIVGSSILILAGYNFSQEWTQEQLNRRATAVNGMLGGWLLVAPFVFEVFNLLIWNDIIVRIGVSSLAIYNVYAAPRIYRTRAQAHGEEV